MKKNQLLVLTSIMLSAFNAQANEDGFSTADQRYTYHNERYEHKIFRLAQPARGMCIGLNNTNNPTKLVSTSCDHSDEAWAAHRMQYVDGTLRTINTYNGVFRCLTAVSGTESALALSSCNGSKEQLFDILKMNLNVPVDTYAISTRSHPTFTCLTNLDIGREVFRPSCQPGFTSNENKGFQLVDVTLPVQVRLVNRGWYNMSFFATYNGKQWAPEWQALDGIRERFLATVSHTNVTPSPLKIETDFNRSHTLNVEPGDFIEAISSGTIFSKSLKVVKKSSTPQLKIYSGYDYASPKGSRYIFDSVPNLMGFNNDIQSFKIPAGWSVRFFEQPNYQGRYYTRSASSAHDSHVDMNIQSIQILSK